MHFKRLLTPLILILCIVYPAQAVDPVHLSETTLIFNGSMNQTLARTVSVIGVDSASEVTPPVPRDLLDSATGGTILSTSITIQLLAYDSTSRQLPLTVTIAGVNSPGTYEGDLQVIVADQNLSLHLVAVINPVPNVVVDPNSVGIRIHATSGLGIFDMGDISAYVSMYNNAEGKALVTGAELLNFRDSSGNTFPPGAVRLAKGSESLTFPLEVSPTSGAIPVRVESKNLFPGDYTGTLLAVVSNQASPIVIPLHVVIKGHWLPPLIVLVIGVGIARLLNWWSSQGRPLIRLQRELAATERDFTPGSDPIFLEDRQRIEGMLRGVQDDINGNSPAEEVEKALNAVRANIDAAKERGKKFLEETLKPKLAGISEEFGEGEFSFISDGLQNAINEVIKPNLCQSRYRDEIEAKPYINGTPYRNGTEEQWLQAYDLFKQVTNEQNKEKLKDILHEVRQDTKTYSDFSTELKNLAPKGDSAGAFELSVTDSKAPQLVKPAASPLITKGNSTWKKLKDIEWFSTIVGYAVVSFLAFAALYAPNETFGANPLIDYVGMLLGGFTVESIRGQVWSLEAIFGQFKR